MNFAAPNIDPDQLKMELPNNALARFSAGFALAVMAVIAALAIYVSARLISDQEYRRYWAVKLRGGEYLGRERVVLQKSNNDCAAAALKMVLDHYGVASTAESLSLRLLDNPQGATMLRLKEVAMEYGLRAGGWRISLQDIKRIPLPAVVLVDRRHYVVLEAVESQSVIYADPAIGRIRINDRYFLKRSNGEMLIISRGALGL